jgi:hypothetical protein
MSGVIYALAKSQPASLMGFAAGINSGIVGLIFFGTSPLLDLWWKEDSNIEQAGLG